jgi:hypothetical protein
MVLETFCSRLLLRGVCVSGAMFALACFGYTQSSTGHWLHGSCPLPGTLAVEPLALPFLFGCGLLVGLFWALRLTRRCDEPTTTP